MAAPNTSNNSRCGSYSDLASEYYDSTRHPTCANFREASEALITHWLRDLGKTGVRILETGAGDSIVANGVPREKLIADCLVATDLSMEMLEYSRKSEFVSQLVVCDAQQLPLVSGSFDLVVASLADPYNTIYFWREVARVLRVNGHVTFSSPSFDWALQFRRASDRAEFVLSNGTLIRVPSYVKPDEDQQRMISDCGLTLIEIRAFKDDEIRKSARSPKLRPGPIVSGFLARKL